MNARFSRRAVLMQMGAAGVAAATVGGLTPRHAYAALDTRPWFFLTDTEARFLAAACDVLIPQDEFPSASQAGVVDFIDLILAAPYGKGEGLYLEPPFMDGAPSQGYQFSMTPAELIRAGIETAEGQDRRLVDLDAEGRETYIRDLSEGKAGWDGPVRSDIFFDELWKLTNQGYFADPIYDGNKDYAGWKMVGFPGAHSYYSDFVDVNAPFPMPPKGISHVPGNGPAELALRFTKEAQDG